jgi:hypothetical protein
MASFTRHCRQTTQPKGTQANEIRRYLNERRQSYQLTREVRKTAPTESGMDLYTPITMEELRGSVNRGKPNKPRVTMVAIMNFLN